MTEKANPSVNRAAEAFKTAGAIAYGGHGDGGFVVSGNTSISEQDPGIDETQLNDFAESHSASSFDVTIDPGEAFVFGTWLAIDTSTTVTLASNTSDQTVYVGWNKDGSDDVIVGLNSAFSNASGDTDRKISLWDFDTDGSGVVTATDTRDVGNTQIVDGKLFYGANREFSVSYNPGTGDLELYDEVNDILVQSWDTSGGSSYPNGRLYANSNITVTDSNGNTLIQTNDGSKVSIPNFGLDAVSVSTDDYNETVNALGSVSGTTGIDLTAGNLVTATLAGNTTFEFNNAVSTPQGNSFTLIFQQDGTGGHTITWPTSVEWTGGTPPGFSTGANDKHVVSFISPDAGTTWIGIEGPRQVA